MTVADDVAGELTGALNLALSVEAKLMGLHRALRDRLLAWRVGRRRDRDRGAAVLQ